jgi:uncharacterized protein
MKFHLSPVSGNVVTGVGPGWVRIGATEYRASLVLTSETIATGWAPAGFERLVEDDFARLVEGAPEVVLFGTGATIRFPSPRTHARPRGGVGLEVMDTPAACRTFNILDAEGRRVTAALLLG